ncbi:hypothetical protein GRI89_09480 [Altererythrobacter salegens]|uniref:Uncharacterized protein n=1 Tax=Croceibacterium salegens TaxID=1737568 RepID=A0A6I4SWP9_9SPHN|nr:hypothetical protein [Croceibacterium salegens]MXO59769.1 hypothetical protein [Croceibacterium salegens]
MKTIISCIVGAAMAFGAISPAIAKDRTAKGEERLAKLIEGRTAGEPVSCINTYSTDNPEIIDRVAMVYKHGKTIYVARPVHPDQLDTSDILVMNRFSSSQICVQDRMHTVDRSSGMTTGVVFLTEFVPYTKEG